MRLGDFIDPERGPANVLKLAVYPLILLIGLQLLASLMRELPAVADTWISSLPARDEPARLPDTQVPSGPTA